MRGETGVGKSHEPQPGDDTGLLMLRKPWCERGTLGISAWLS